MKKNKKGIIISIRDRYGPQPPKSLFIDSIKLDRIHEWVVHVMNRQTITTTVKPTALPRAVNLMLHLSAAEKKGNTRSLSLYYMTPEHILNALTDNLKTNPYHRSEF